MVAIQAFIQICLFVCLFVLGVGAGKWVYLTLLNVVCSVFNVFKQQGHGIIL